MQIQTAFLENPTLSLTLPAAQRRFGLDEVTCAGLLGALVDAQVLTQRDGAYSGTFHDRRSTGRLKAEKGAGSESEACPRRRL